MKRLGCFKVVFFIAAAFALLYFLVGEGKTVILKKVYPIKYQEYVERYAEEFSLDKNLVYAIIKTESNFKENAVSSVGAKGLMQMMEKTALECNKKGEFGYNIPEDLYNPEANIRLGCYYIGSLIDHYKDTQLAVMAYNAGTGNVSKWLKDEEISDGEGGILEIPYKETRNYVKKVFGTFEMYNRIYKINE